jgi:cytochrome P450
MAQSTFVGVSQTLPRLLVNGWLALFEHPAEVARLRTNPELMASSVEELLRYAGIIPKLYRKARQPLEVAGIQLAAGDRVTLMVASANRDPEKFADPNRLDVSRRAVGQLTLGIGHNSCAGARLIRTANAVAIGAMLNAFSDVRVTGTIPWSDASGFRWPSSVHASFRRRATV